jgi:hypothetical protein
MAVDGTPSQSTSPATTSGTARALQDCVELTTNALAIESLQQLRGQHGPHGDHTCQRLAPTTKAMAAWTLE